MPKLHTLALIGLACVLCFYLGQRQVRQDAQSPCVSSFDADGHTYCVMTPAAAAVEKSKYGFKTSTR